MTKDSDATDKGLVACRLGFWAERRTALQRVDACQQSERYNKVCDPRSSWFVTLSYRRRAVDRSIRLDRAHHPFTSGAASRIIDDDDGRR